MQVTTRNPSLSVVPTKKAKIDEQELSTNDTWVGPRPADWYTGLPPASCPGFDASGRCLRSLPVPNLNNLTRQSVLDYFNNAWTLTEVLFASLQGESTFVRAPYHQLRHPMMFYYGHPAVLYVNKFRVAGLLEEGIDAMMEQMFETGVDEMSWDDLAVPSDCWPSVKAVHEYRQKAYKRVCDVINHHPSLEQGTANWDTPAWAIVMGIEHERIHIETSSVLIRELPAHLLVKPEFWPEYHPSATLPSAAHPEAAKDYPINPLLHVPGGSVLLGKHMAYPSFGWDNEYGARPIEVPEFKASKFKITNGEFLEFVKAGGYHNPEFWSEDGWGWKTFRNVKWPTFWVPNGPAGLHMYKLRTVFEVIPMRWNWPVDVNYLEAAAFAAWRTKTTASPVAMRIITEAEHMLIRSPRDRVDAPMAKAAANGAASGHAKSTAPLADAECNVDVAMAVGGDNAAKWGFNFQLAYGSQSPVGELGETEAGFADAMGNAWEWGEDHFTAYPGFKVHPYYEDFSSPCFGGQHQMIIGGSFVSTGQLTSKFARYQFRPHFFQHASFRLVLPMPDLADYPSNSTQPIKPFFQTSCMDAPPPHVGSTACCSTSRRSRFTPTRAESAAADKAKLESTKRNYETDSLMAQYLSLHFGPAEQAFSSFAQETGLLQDALSFPKKCGKLTTDWARRCNIPMKRVLDLGCAVGGAAFEMTKDFEEVLGIDISSTFVSAADKMKTERRTEYSLQVEGEIMEKLVAELDSDVNPDRATFMQGDACNIPAIGTFDAVLMANLLCRVPDPQSCLEQVSSLIHPGGILVMTSPFTWMTDYTEKSQWVGGVSTDGGKPLSCAEALKGRLSKWFDVLVDDQMPLLIREHSRKYQLILAHRLVLRKRE